MDMTCCPKCKTSYLLEIQRTQSKVKKSLHAETMKSADQTQTPTPLVNSNKVKESTSSIDQTNTSLEENWDLDCDQKDTKFDLSNTNTVPCANQFPMSVTTKAGSNEKQVSLVAPFSSVDLKKSQSPECGLKRTISNIKTEPLKSGLFSGTTSASASIQISDKKDQCEESGKVSKSKLVDCEVQTEFTVQVVDEPAWQPPAGMTRASKVNKLLQGSPVSLPPEPYTAPVHKFGAISIGTFRAQKPIDIQARVQPLARTTVNEGKPSGLQQIGLDKKQPTSSVLRGIDSSHSDRKQARGNLPIVNSTGAGDMYCYSPRKAVDAVDEHSLLLKAIKQSRNRETLGNDFSDLTSAQWRF